MGTGLELADHKTEDNRVYYHNGVWIKKHSYEVPRKDYGQQTHVYGTLDPH